jgi:tungstate transport system permease protein
LPAAGGRLHDGCGGQGVDPALRVQVRALGASPWQTAWAILDETRVGVIAAVVAGFGGIISEVGAVMLVGGNIEGARACSPPPLCWRPTRATSPWPWRWASMLLSIAFATNFIILRLQGRSL